MSWLGVHRAYLVFKNNSSVIIIAMQRSFHSQIEIPQNDHVSALTHNYFFLWVYYKYLNVRFTHTSCEL